MPEPWRRTAPMRTPWISCSDKESVELRATEPWRCECPERVARQQKSPAKRMGLVSHTLSREECQPAAAWVGSLTLGLVRPITVAGPWPIFTAFPRFPCLQDVAVSLVCRARTCQRRRVYGRRPTKNRGWARGSRKDDFDQTKVRIRPSSCRSFRLGVSWWCRRLPIGKSELKGTRPEWI
jgi:hypothetical protein